MISIIVPCYNEKETVGTIVDALKQLSFDKEIIVVDDGSTEKVEVNANATIFHKKNRGKGAAIRTGLEYAKGDIVVIQDADLEYPPKNLPKVIQPILEGHADVVYGNRFNNHYIEHIRFTNYLANKFLTWLVNRFTGLKLNDMETGCKAFKKRILEKLDLQQDRFGFEPEVTIKLAKLGCKIKEVPISYWARDKREGKKIGFWDGLNAILCILRYV